MKKLNILVYALFGTVTVLLGLGALLFPATIEPELQSALSIHLLREQGAVTIFLGLMSFWCICHYEQRRTVHYFLMVFTLLLAGIHWFEYFNGRRTLASPLINSLPFVLLLLMVLTSRGKNRKA